MVASSKVSPPEWGGQRATVVRLGHLGAVMNMDALRLQEVLQEVLPCCDTPAIFQFMFTSLSQTKMCFLPISCVGKAPKPAMIPWGCCPFRCIAR